jgi:solute carrier family 25 (mitochondrial S-adenosylmethionine transporter), member 26
MSVDLSLYPIDTLKTRLQSSKGFYASGGFRGIYAGVGSAALGAAPGAALFFVTYEWTKSFLRIQKEARLVTRPEEDAWFEPFQHMVAASAGEIAACAVRVPTEVVKQRAQAREYRSSVAALAAILEQRKNIGSVGVFKELYRGFGITIMREVPFTVIQFPLWEAMKNWRRAQGLETVSALDSAIFGSIAGAIAAGITTPLDVLKTRMMLSREKKNVLPLLQEIMKQSGPRAFFAGIGPRVFWISAGGFIFLGSYQFAYNSLSR